MKVYRFVHKKELEIMLNGDNLALGKYCCNGFFANTHKYKLGRKYLHFFYSKEACQHIIDDIMFYSLDINKNGNVKDYYICTFNIPIKYLLLHTGKGYYKALDGQDSGYDEMFKTRFEVAIESDKFDKKWLKKYEPAVYEKGRHINQVIDKERE